MDLPVVLKIASVSLAILGAAVSFYARSVPLAQQDDPDRMKRRWYLVSYGLTSASILLFAAIGFV
jgi:hypothetical protein